MSPELRRRIQRSVSGESVLSVRGAKRPQVRSLLRLALFSGISLLSIWLVSSYRAEQRALGASRTSLEARWAHSRAGLTATDLDMNHDILALIEAESGTYRGNVPSTQRGPEGTARLSGPGIFLRLTMEEALNESAIVARSAERGKDAFLSCFIAPPPAPDEKSTLSWVRKSYSAEFAGAEQLSQFFSASKLFLATTVLSAEFGAAIARANTLRDYRRLDQALDDAHLKETLPSLAATTFLLVLDEPKAIGSVTELDGASPHWVRFSLIDLTTKSVLFRFREKVDPSWVSEKNRPRYAYSLDSCALGSKMRAEFLGPGQVLPTQAEHDSTPSQ